MLKQYLCKKELLNVYCSNLNYWIASKSERATNTIEKATSECVSVNREFSYPHELKRNEYYCQKWHLHNFTIQIFENKRFRWTTKMNNDFNLKEMLALLTLSIFPKTFSSLYYKLPPPPSSSQSFWKPFLNLIFHIGCNVCNVWNFAAVIIYCERFIWGLWNLDNTIFPYLLFSIY